MKIKNFYFTWILFLLAVPASAQTVRYVAYFPIPYISHQKIEADTAYFAGKDGAEVSVGGQLTAQSLNTKRDLELISTAASSTIDKLSVGILADDDSNSSDSGDFVVNRQGGTLNLTQLTHHGDGLQLASQEGTIESSQTTSTHLQELKADSELKISNIKWRWGQQTYKAFVMSTTNSFESATSSDDGIPIGTTKLCWSPLRLKGSYEYKYYLIAIKDGNCPS